MTGGSIISQIELIDSEIADHQKRVDRIEEDLHRADTSDGKQEELRDKKTKLLAEMEERRLKLKELRRENRKTSMFSAIIVGLMFLTYLIFSG